MSLEGTGQLFSAMSGVFQSTSYEGFHVLILLHDAHTHSEKAQRP